MDYCTPEGFENVIKKLAEANDRDAFFSWFDGGEDVEGAFSKAQDIFLRLFLPYAKKYLENLSEKTSLDIGYGGGGQVLEASYHFDHSYGIDVHGEGGFVSEELLNRGAQREDFSLIKSDGYFIPLPDSSIDFVHSWVTFIHFSVLSMVLGYLGEINRVLRPGGIAVVYFPRYIRSSTRQTWNQVKEDIVLENKDKVGFREGGMTSKVRSISIVISMWKMEAMSESAGFKVLERTASWSKEGKRKFFHGQHGIVIQKPVIESSSVSTPSIVSGSEESPPVEEEKRSSILLRRTSRKK